MNQHDVDFLTGFANVLAEAVATSARHGYPAEHHRAHASPRRGEDRLLEQKKVLAEELQHRVRNNCSWFYGMLSKQLDDTPIPPGNAHQGHLAPGFRLWRRYMTICSERYERRPISCYVQIALPSISRRSGGARRHRHADLRQRRHRARSRCGDGRWESSSPRWSPTAMDHAFPDGRRGRLP